MTASFSVAQKIETYMTLPASALMTTQGTYTGQNIGAGRIDQVKTGAKHTVLISEIITVCILAVVFIFARPIAAAFGLGSEAIGYCAAHVRFVALCLPLFASYFPLLGLFQGANNALFSTFGATGALTVRVATIYLFQGVPGVGYHMIWWNTLFGWGFSFVISWVHFLRGRWSNKWRIPEHFTSDWKPDLECNKEQPADQFKPYGATPGHGIEWARLIAQWAVSLYEKNARQKNDGNPETGCMSIMGKYIDASENLYNRAVSDAWKVDGVPGIVYTTDWEGKPVVYDRMHWTLAEAVNTSAVLYRITGNEKYSKDYAAFMEYIDAFLIDHVNGSWYHQLDRNNKAISTVWPGKPDIYHAFQAALIPYYSVGLSIASGVKENKIL